MYRKILVLAYFLCAKTDEHAKYIIPKHRKNRPKLSQNVSHDRIHQNDYGVDLPSFSFDYRELFSAAMISRSADSMNSLHLVMFMVGHRSIEANGPFEAISTEEEILYSWTQAVRYWTPGRQLSPFFSGFYCIIQNNELVEINQDILNEQNKKVTPLPPYQVPAYWIHTHQPNKKRDIYHNLTHLEDIFMMLSCKIKGVSSVFRSNTHRSDRSLYIDLIRKKNIGKPQPSFTSKPNISIIDERNSIGALETPYLNTNATQQEGTDSHVVISFSVPWRTRQRGYAFHFEGNSSTLDPWANLAGNLLLVAYSEYFYYVINYKINITFKKINFSSWFF
jgi:hypothetical protein